MNIKTKFSFVKSAIVLSVAVSLYSAGVAASDRWFGYYANDYKVHENKDHTNVTHIWAGFSSKENAKAHILAQLQLAKAHGKKAIIEVSSFVFFGSI